MSVKQALVFGLCLSFLVGLAYAQDVGSVIEELPDGTIDWSTGVIQAKGIGAPPPPEVAVNVAQARAMALQAARTVAERNLLRTIQGVRVNSETVVNNFIVESDVIKTKVSGFLKGSRVIKEAYMSDGSIEVTIEAPINGVGGLGDIIFSQEMKPTPVYTPTITRTPTEVPEFCPTCGQKWPKGRKYTPPTPPLVGEIYTGLIVDTRGLGIKPCMSPRIVTPDGTEVYGSMYVSRKYAITQGIVGYARDLEQAKKCERVTDKPLIITGLEATGPNKTDVVISTDDADILHFAKENLNFLEKCRVMFIVD